MQRAKPVWMAVLFMWAMILSAVAESYQITVTWQPPEYDIDGVLIEEELFYQLYARYASEQPFVAYDGLQTGTTAVFEGVAGGCFSVYVTAKKAFSPESDPSETVEHCTDSEDDGTGNVPESPVILEIRSQPEGGF